jgi:hypothetical protein
MADAMVGAAPSVRGVPAMRRLRVAVCTGSDQVERWQADCLQRLSANDSVEWFIAPADRRAAPDRVGPAWARYKRANCRSQSGRLAPLAVCAAASRPGSTPCPLDVVLVFGGARPSDDLVRHARYGAWAFEHDQAHNAPPFFWALRRGDPVTLVRLLRFAPGPSSVLAEATLPTALRSYTRQLDAARLLAPALLEHTCRRVETDAVAETRPASAASADRRPRLRDCLSLSLRTIASRASNAFSLLFHHDQWAVGVVSQPAHGFLTDRPHSATHWYTAGKRSAFLADPFAVETRDGLVILAETYDYAEGVGHIAAVTVGPSGASQLRTVLSPPFHLSYPVLIEDAGEQYCLPEASASGQLRLWRARRFPYEWEPADVLLDNTRALDATPLFHEGRWWLFAALKEGPAALSLNAWHSESLRGAWTRHTLNPLKLDIASSRPAGTFFTHEGRLYRPAQDGSTTYGGAISICRIDRLSPTEFAETVVARVRPDPRGPYPAGLHTLCALGDRTLIDGKRRIFIPAAFRAQCAAWARQLARPSRASTPSNIAAFSL